LKSCLDFAQEAGGTQLQTTARAHGMVVTYTPKYHAEIVEVGIEYSWVATKSQFCRIPYEQKKTREKFFEAIWTSLKILTKETVRKCARAARNYIQAYYVVEVLHIFEGVEGAGNKFKGGFG
jgi:hypothetical protein